MTNFRVALVGPAKSGKTRILSILSNCFEESHVYNTKATVGIHQQKIQTDNLEISITDSAGNPNFYQTGNQNLQHHDAAIIPVDLYSSTSTIEEIVKNALERLTDNGKAPAPQIILLGAKMKEHAPKDPSQDKSTAKIAELKEFAEKNHYDYLIDALVTDSKKTLIAKLNATQQAIKKAKEEAAETALNQFLQQARKVLNPNEKEIRSTGIIPACFYVCTNDGAPEETSAELATLATDIKNACLSEKPDREAILEKVKQCQTIIKNNHWLANLFKAFLITAISIGFGACAGATLAATASGLNPLVIAVGAAMGAAGGALGGLAVTGGMSYSLFCQRGQRKQLLKEMDDFEKQLTAYPSNPLQLS